MRALLSTWDKDGLIELGRGLHALGYELIASGGSARTLADADLPVEPVESVTGFPEVLGGRVKTLHPAIHAGLLARPTDEHLGELADRGLAPIDLVVCNLYPFSDTVADPDVTEGAAVEQIDIGGVTLLRAAAKNFERVVVVCDPAEYAGLLTELGLGAMTLERRRELALAAFRHTAAYDAAIATWLGGQSAVPGELPESLHLAAERVETLRYGENPHQQAALYRWQGSAPAFEQIQGKALSYNNIADLEAAWAMPAEYDRPAVAIVKHANPCGLAVGASAAEAFAKALACDPVSAFGSIIASNRPVDIDFVKGIGKLFMEVLVAPDFSDEALAWLGRRKKNCRVLRASTPGTSSGPLPGLFTRTVAGGLLVQTDDTTGADRSAWRVATERQPAEAELDDLAFAWLACKHVKSNAILLASDGATVGIGAGQMNRVDAVRIAARAAGEKAKGAVLASDAFFPFADGVEAAAAAGVTACVQPGGSKRDPEVIEAANRLGLAMVLTGERHFRHV